MRYCLYVPESIGNIADSHFNKIDFIFYYFCIIIL